MTKLIHHEDRLELAVLGWQAECALQHNAAHLATSWRFAIGNDMMPDDMLACVQLGRASLRAHLAAVRGDPDHTTIATPDPLAPPPVTPKFEAVLTVTTKTGTRNRTSQVLVSGDPGGTAGQFLHKVTVALTELARE